MLEERDGRPLDGLNPAEAVMGFAAWLSTLDTPVTFGASSPCDIACEMVGLFNDVNELPAIREHWEKNLTHPVDPRGVASDQVEVTPEVVADPYSHYINIENAAKALVEKLDKIVLSDEYKSVFTIAQLHNTPYNGETFSIEMANLKRALGLPGGPLT